MKRVTTIHIHAATRKFIRLLFNAKQHFVVVVVVVDSRRTVPKSRLI